jgi:ubiquinone/menaquinone biosynthesis C-methylase UbiE
MTKMKIEKRKGWEEFYSALDQLPEWLMAPVPFVVESVPFFKDRAVRTVLDLGCGLGRNCIYLAKEGFEAIGVDPSKNALKTAKARCKIEGADKVTVLRASMTNLPFRDECLQAVISVSVIHHAARKDINRTTREICRVLKDNGVFLANLLSVEDYRYGSGREIEDGTFMVQEDFEEGQFKEIHHFFTRQETSKLLAGFRKISIEPLQGGKREQLHCYWKVTAIK